MKRYRTIVADPPWPYKRTTPSNPRCVVCGHLQMDHRHIRCRCQKPRWVANDYKMPYDTLTLETIRAIPVKSLASDNAHLFLWTTRRFLREAFGVAESWDFVPRYPMVWCKPPRGLMGGTFAAQTEYVLFCRRGNPVTTGREYRDWWTWPRTSHSAKPDAFLDLVERVSPGPYVELFARRARFGWDYWGDESLRTAEMPWGETASGMG